MPLGLDFLPRIINVHWGGGVIFVYGEWLGNKLHFVKIIGRSDDSPEKQTISLPEPDSTDLETRGVSLFGITGSSFANVKSADVEEKGIATFLICGLRTVPHEIADDIFRVDSHAMIYISNDGRKWSEARHQTAVRDDRHNKSINVAALVWNLETNSFYYDQSYSENIDTTLGSEDVTTISDQIFSSANGESWAMNSSTETHAGDSDYRSEFSSSFCEDNDCIDEREQNVPDGVMANDVKNKTTAKPTKPPVIFYEQGTINYTPGENTVEIKRTEQDTDGNPKIVTERISIPGIECITCVAGYGDIFMAGGFVAKDDVEFAGAVALSTDGGKTWKPFDTTDNGVVTMIAAPASDTRDADL